MVKFHSCSCLILAICWWCWFSSLIGIFLVIISWEFSVWIAIGIEMHWLMPSVGWKHKYIYIIIISLKNKEHLPSSIDNCNCPVLIKFCKISWGKLDKFSNNSFWSNIFSFIFCCCINCWCSIILSSSKFLWFSDFWFCR